MVSFYLEMIRNIISETKHLRIFREVVVLPEPPVADTVAVSGCLGQHNIATSSPGSSRFPIWRPQERRPWHTAEIT